MLHSRPVWTCAAVFGLVVSLTGCGQMRSLTSKQKAPTNSSQLELRMNMARLHEREGNLGKAEAEMKKLMVEFPGATRVQHRLGIVQIRQGKSEEGIRNLLEAAASEPDNVDLLNDLGYAYFNIGDYEAAEGMFREALRINVTNPKTTNNLALVIGFQGHTEDAYQLFRRNMSEAEALANIGYIHTQRGELDLALARYSDALNHDPKMKSAADAMVQIYQLQRRIDAMPEDAKVAAAERAADLEAERNPIILTEGR